MKKTSHFAQALHIAIGGAILTAAVLTCGNASAGAQTECSARSGALRAIVRQSDRLPDVCIRIILSGPPLFGVPDCWTAVRNDPAFTCTQIVD